MSAPKSKKARPSLPFANANPLLKTGWSALPLLHTCSLNDSTLVEKEPPVKYQVIEREGQEIIVSDSLHEFTARAEIFAQIGRVKVPTPNNGHAFILRRYDTGAVSLTTMFRAAFPDASDDDEKNDSTWIKQAYDITGANGGYRGNTKQVLRLAGTWLPVEAALAVAESYAIHSIVKPLTEAEPEPNQHFRKSAAANGTSELLDLKPTSTAAPAPAKPVSPPAKRRRMASPASTTSAPLSPPVATRKLRSSKSPAPTKKATTPKPRSSRRLAGKTASPAPEVTDEEMAYIEVVKPDADIEESKQLVEEIKANFGKPSSKAAGVKRPAGDDALTFVPKEPEIGERVFAGPRRLRNLPPQRQSLAWGALFFTVGAGAA
jgi:hypothetical protein